VKGAAQIKPFRTAIAAALEIVDVCSNQALHGGINCVLVEIFSVRARVNQLRVLPIERGERRIDASDLTRRPAVPPIDQLVDTVCL
jgi:hypothetical protein